jgi:hypothetical protein
MYLPTERTTISQNFCEPTTTTTTTKTSTTTTTTTT